MTDAVLPMLERPAGTLGDLPHECYETVVRPDVQHERRHLHEQADRPSVALLAPIVKCNADRDPLSPADPAEISGEGCTEEIRGRRMLAHRRRAERACKSGERFAGGGVEPQDHPLLSRGSRRIDTVEAGRCMNLREQFAPVISRGPVLRRAAQSAHRRNVISKLRWCGRSVELTRVKLGHAAKQDLNSRAVGDDVMNVQKPDVLAPGDPDQGGVEYPLLEPQGAAQPRVDPLLERTLRGGVSIENDAIQPGLKGREYALPGNSIHLLDDSPQRIARVDERLPGALKLLWIQARPSNGVCGIIERQPGMQPLTGINQQLAAGQV